ncbi:hypothetical protein N9165_03360 [Akkermansiaceae bacterium]|nr:hypothetical protein [Akkermansiaceae bacterium]
MKMLATGLLTSGGELLHQELLGGEEEPRAVVLTQKLAHKILGNEMLITSWDARAGKFLEQLVQRHVDKIEKLVGGMVEC